MSQVCPLCSCPSQLDFYVDKRRAYQRCQRCYLVWVASEYQLSREAEKAEYDLHQNEVDDPGYRRFLNRLAEPLLARLQPGAQGLDFGCGPGPALASMLEQAGMNVRLYDVYYFNVSESLCMHYDFICATEVIEHLSQPGAELRRLWALLKPGGMLALMSKLVIDREAFSRWHYKNDATHISFFSKQTLSWLASEFDAELSYHAEDVFFLTKKTLA
ncbi:class I SAM-dependent methyltransferase [Agaribacterium haliotis]|uniref:class I SAM-dependent methyltransferase n=1 Tax=Agaribacterium haliotis TaxID=2013869 RepID=UPI000BB59925|nr:class I SAM-dependent methyltransferase [Agaribacterium haliotis]